MKKIIIPFFLLLLIHNSSVNSQNIEKTNSEVKLELKNLNLRLKDLEEKFENRKLEERLEFAHEVIQSQDSLFSGLGTTFTLLSIILAIIALISPFAVYVFGIRPARKSIHDIKNEMKTYLIEFQKIQIENALSNIKSSDLQTKKDAELFLSLNQYYEFSNSQIFDIYTMISEETEQNSKDLLKFILLSRKSKYAEIYFDSLLNGDYDARNDFYIAKYLALTEIDAKIEKLLQYIKKCKVKQHALFNILNNLYSFSNKNTLVLATSEKILEIFNESEYTDLLKGMESTLINKNLFDSFKNSNLYKKINNDA